MNACQQVKGEGTHEPKAHTAVASHKDILWGSSCVPAPLTFVEPKDKFLSLCSQISAGDHMQIIGDPISAVEAKNTRTSSVS